MLMSDGEIRLAIANDELIIDPPLPNDDRRLQPASIDLTLDSEIWRPNRHSYAPTVIPVPQPSFLCPNRHSGESRNPAP